MLCCSVLCFAVLRRAKSSPDPQQLAVPGQSGRAVGHGMTLARKGRNDRLSREAEKARRLGDDTC